MIFAKMNPSKSLRLTHRPVASYFPDVIAGASWLDISLVMYETATCSASACLCSPLDKSSMLLNRFDDDLLLTAESLERPDYRRRTRVRGKARAIHTFRAQNNRFCTICEI